MKKAIKVLSVILIICVLLPSFTIFAKTNVPYKKTGTVYTVSEKNYYQAETSSEYNGVAKGTEFWLDANNNIVTDTTVLNKIIALDILATDNFFYLIETTMGTTLEAARGYYDVFTSISAVNKLGTIVGTFSGTAISLMTNTAYGFTDIAIDIGSEALSTESLKTVGLITMLKIYANNCDANLNAVKNLRKSASTNYDSLLSLIENYAESQACLAAIVYLAGDEIQEYVNSSLWNKLLNYFNDVLGGIADSVIPDEWAIELLNAFVDGTISVIPLTELTLSTNADKVFSLKKQEVYNSQIKVLNKVDYSTLKNIADKLTKTSQNNSPKYPTGTYKPSHSEGLNMRSGASTSNSIVGAIAYVTSFVVNQVNGNWGKTTCNGKTGWVCLDYATLSNSSNNTQNAIDSSSNMSVETFYEKLNKFKEKYPHGSRYVDDPSKTGGYQCFGFANELGVDIFGTYPTNSMSATGVNSTWTVTYGGDAVDSLCVGDIVRYHYHSIFITKIVGDTIYFCEALGDLNNKVQWEQSISRNTLKKYVSEKLTSANTNKTGWVAHCKNGVSIKDSQSTPTHENSPIYETIPEGAYVINSIVNDYRYLTAKTDSNGGQVEAKPFENIDAQKFEIVACENGYQIICQNSSSGRVINVYRDGTSKNGDNVTLWSSTKSETQIWTFEKNGDAYIIRPSDNANIALTAGSTGRVTVSTYTGASNQLWKLSPKNEEPEKYTVTYNANSGAGAPGTQTKTHAEDIKLSTQEPTRKDYIFLGWSTSPEGSVEYGAGSNFTLNENVTLYAIWQKEENEVYYIIYNANGGQNAPSMQTKNEDEDAIISNIVPIREGYIFDGWAIGDSDTIAYSSGDVYKENKTLYLHAVWIADTYKISYNSNGGTNAPKSQIKTHDQLLILNVTVPVKEGFVFVNWYDGADVYNPGSIFEKNADTVLSAVWEKSEEEEFPFVDVPEDAWYKDDVKNAYEKGIVNGKGENRYAPEDNMTYAEAIKLACTIYQLYYDGEVTLTNGSDVWYSTYMDYALENRIVRTDYSSVANEYVTRKEFVNIFYGALPLKEFAKINNVEDNIIPDVKIGDAYSGEIYTFYRTGILTGNDAKGTFKPDSNISRSEVAAIVTRMLDSGARKQINIK